MLADGLYASISYLKPNVDESLGDLLNSALQTIFDCLPGFSQAEYHAWIADNALNGEDMRNLARALGRLVDPPQLEVLIAGGADTTTLLATLDSLSQQVWPNFSVSIGCAPNDELDLQRLIDARKVTQPSIRLLPVAPAADDIFAVDRAMLEAASGDYVAFLAPGDIVPTQATAEIALALSRLPETIVIFTDEDWIDVDGVRSCPRFKNGWDPDAQLGFDLMGRFSPMQRMAALAAGGLPQEAGLAAHYKLHCRLAEMAGPSRIVHISSVLRHALRQRATSPELADSYALSSRTVAQEAARRWEGVRVVARAASLAPWFNRIEWPLPVSAPLVSVLLPTRDRPELLETSARGVLENTDYPAIELLVLDNGSVEPETITLFSRLARDPRVRILPMPGPFNYSRLNNAGAASAQGEILVLLNNDVEIIGADWLREMVSLASRPEIACVGAKLLYPDHRIQHAGINMAARTGCAHVGRLFQDEEPGDMGSLAVTRTHSAVTGACLAIRAEVFAEIGGLDEAALQVAYNDVDLCLKARDHGYRSVCSPFAILFHLENVSRRTSDDTQRGRERAESERALGRWREVFLDDPYQNPNTLLMWDGTPRLVRSRRLQEWDGSR